MKRTSRELVDNLAVNRRRFLSTALGACAISPPLGFLPVQLAANMSGSLTKEQRDSMTPIFLSLGVERRSGQSSSKKAASSASARAF